jgi:cation-transporting ATPase E
MVLADQPGSTARRQADDLAATGVRVLVLAHSSAPLTGEALPGELVPLALVTFVERVRPDAGETLAFFDEQGVTLRVISGDNPRTVGAVARQVGLPGGDTTFDAREFPEDLDAAAEILERTAVFGRVSPQQKRSMVKALQARGHVVAMTGDGVNDALALKDADIGVAMGSGAPATRAVAQLVLLDGRFSHMPRVVAEGRRVIANIERVANLFVIKNIYAGVLSVMTTVFGQTYPFLPRHLTIVSALTIGIPAFFLALAPNNQRYQPGFLRRVAVRSMPIGVLAAIAIFTGYLLADRTGATRDEARTAATVVIVCVGLGVLVQLARPWNAWKLGLVGAMGGLFALALVVPTAKEAFKLDIPVGTLLESLLVGGAGAAAVAGIWEIGDRWLKRRYPPS